MPSDNQFRCLIARVRAGDPQAAEELVRTYEPEIRRVVRMWLTAPNLRRVLDSMDVCQSVLGNFFVRVAAGQFELERPKDLVKLLVTMARNKMRDQARRLKTARRDQRRDLADGDKALAAVEDNRASPSQVICSRELLREILSRMSEQERFLTEQRGLGRNWAEIAQEVGRSPDAARMQFNRALNRVLQELSLEEVDDDGSWRALSPEVTHGRQTEFGRGRPSPY
jgi:RNA polymerase sigma-70 factor (ECF subfamily)